MKYQIYLQKDVSEIVEELSKNLNTKSSTLIKQMIEDTLRSAYELASGFEKKEEKGGANENATKQI